MTTIVAIQKLQKKMNELVSEISAERKRFFEQDHEESSQADLALYLVLQNLDIGRSLPLLDEELRDLILKSLALPVLSQGNEIFAGEFIDPANSAYGCGINWAILFTSNGLPKLTYDAGNIGVTFPECDYKVFLHTTDAGDFHTIHGCPTIELYTSPDSFNLPEPRRRVTKTTGPFPAKVLLDEIMTGNPAKYGNLVCKGTPLGHFIAAPKVHNTEGKWIVEHIRKFAEETKNG